MENKKISKKDLKAFEKKVIKQLKDVYCYDSKLKVEIIQPAIVYKTTIQMEVTINKHILFIDTLKVRPKLLDAIGYVATSPFSYKMLSIRFLLSEKEFYSFLSS
jgi:hypothetical protein